MAPGSLTARWWVSWNSRVKRLAAAAAQPRDQRGIVPLVHDDEVGAVAGRFQRSTSSGDRRRG